MRVFSVSFLFLVENFLFKGIFNFYESFSIGWMDASSVFAQICSVLIVRPLKLTR
jgi:hypothetical protein